MYTRISFIAIFILATILLNNKSANAQDVYVDSVFTKLKLGTKIITSLRESGPANFDEKEFEHDHENEDKGKEYGIGNILGKKKKSTTANKKTGKSIKIDLNIFGWQTIEYEIKYDKGTFQITKSEADE